MKIKGGLISNINKSFLQDNKYKKPQFLIEMIEGYYLFDSVKQNITQIDNFSMFYSNNVSINLKTKIKNLWEKGVYYKNNVYSKLESRPYDIFLKNIPSLTEREKLNILLLFYPLQAIFSNKKLPKPIILEKKQQYRGGNNNIRYLSTDFRRHVLAVIIPELFDSEKYNNGRFILKLAMNDYYSSAYEDESKIYQFLDSKQNNQIVKYFGSGYLTTNEINIPSTSSEIDLNDLPNIDTYKNKFYLLLEDTYEYMDYRDFLNELDVNNTKYTTEVVSKSLLKILKQIHHLNKEYGFFHGDLHAGNIKVQNQNNIINVKLFDFDFSAIVGNKRKIISKNLQLYNLQFENKEVFTENNINTLLDSIILKKFFYIFDFFRLWLSTMIELKHKILYLSFNDSENSKILDIFRNWLLKQENIDWSTYFKNSYIYDNLYNELSNDNVVKNSTNQNVVQMTLEEQLARFEELKLGSDDESSNFSSSLGGQKNRSYKRLGVYNVKTNSNNNQSTRARVVWTYNKQYFIRDKNHKFIKIRKTNIV